MNTDVQTTPADSSAPAFEIPRDSAGYDHWRKTGEVKAPEPKAEKTAPAQEESESAPATDTGETSRQERSRPKRGAEERLTELLEDLKKAGLSPKELKSFKREAQQQAAAEETNALKRGSSAAIPAAAESAKADPPKAAEPAKPETYGLTAPVKPKVEDFSSYDEYEAAKEKYFEDVAEFKAELKMRERDARQRQEAAAREQQQKFEAATKRYGADAGKTIEATAKSILNDTQIPQAVKAMLDGSPVVIDLVYAIGTREEAKDFIELSRTDPGKAIRKLVVLEQLVEAELAKAGDTVTETPERDESGQFVSSSSAQQGVVRDTAKKAPVKTTTEAPPPPREASGRSAAPRDEVDRAVSANDFSTYREAANRRDLARMSGRAA